MTSVYFSGFPEETFRFFQELKNNNDREWFEANKKRYKELVLEPAKLFVLAFGHKLRELDAEIVIDPRTSGSGNLMRIYRDVRFSKDKSPYHTKLRFVFWPEGGKRMVSPFFFLGFDGSGGVVYSGVRKFTPAQLSAFRKAVVDSAAGKELAEILAALRETKKVHIGGEYYKNVPRNFDRNHPRADLLRFNGLHGISPKIPFDSLIGPQVVDECVRQCQILFPLYRWLKAYLPLI